MSRRAYLYFSQFSALALGICLTLVVFDHDGKEWWQWGIMTIVLAIQLRNMVKAGRAALDLASQLDLRSSRRDDR